MDLPVPAARAVLERLGKFLDRFAGCFGRRAQRKGASRYVQGILNDSSRKSMQPMEARLSLNDAASYQRLQHFITHSPARVERWGSPMHLCVRRNYGTLSIAMISGFRYGVALPIHCVYIRCG